VRLQKLHAVQLNKLYAHLLDEGRMDGEGGLSARTVRYVHTILRRALKDGVRWGRLEHNPADLADPPKQDRAHGGHMRTWDASQQRRWLEYVADDRLAAAWTLLITTGMRRGEILGLRWTDVDLDNARLAVRQTYVSVDGNAQFSEPKTRMSRRSIDLDERTVQVMRDWRKVQDEDREEWTTVGVWEEHGLVFTQRNGRPLDPDHFSQDFVRLSREAGLPRIRLHDARHSHATLLLAAGVDPKVASERLGHHSVAFTLDVYSHVVPGMQAEAAEKIAGLIHGPRSDEDHAGDETRAPAGESEDAQDPRDVI
jgi:integrase